MKVFSRSFTTVCEGLLLVLLCCGVMLLMNGCAAISKEARSQVTYDGPFIYVQQNPSVYAGAKVLLGGKILETRSDAFGSEIEVLHMPLDGWERPVDEDRSEGRYLVFIEEFPDPEIYRKGRQLTMVGLLRDTEIRTIGDYDYRFPRFEVIELKLWDPLNRITPVFQIGVGVGGSF